jgi:hypothetical protein
MSYSFHPAAEDEFLDAIEYYENREEGLGLDFAIEVYATIDRATRHPSAWPVLDGEVRRCQTKRFPYGGASIPKRRRASSFLPSCISTATRTTGSTGADEWRWGHPQPPLAFLHGS